MNIIRRAAVALSLGVLACAAHASLIGTITRDYGSSPGDVSALSLGAGSCDTLNAHSITVRNGSNCTRFDDVFDFASMNPATVDALVLTLTFANTDSPFEAWVVRPASSTSKGSNLLFDYLFSTGSSSMTETFVFDALDLDMFKSIVADDSFYLWFAQQGFGSQSFTLESASLEVFGSAKVPEPTSLALLAAAAAALVLTRRRPRRQA